jgi:hypothetical protein
MKTVGTTVTWQTRTAQPRSISLSTMVFDN